MALPMTDEDIRTNYRDAKNQAKQIGILAELNNCNKEIIKDIIKEDPTLIHSYTRLNEGVALKLYNAGKSNKEIATALGVTAETVRNWKKRVGITPIIPTTQTKEEELEEMNQTPDETKQAAQAAEIIQPLGALAPETVGERIDAVLALRKATDSESVNEAFGLLCSRLLANVLGL